jgi:putative transposase
MPRRKIPIVTGRYYHVFNSGINGENTFTHKYHYQKAIEGLWYYRYDKPPIRLAYFKSLNQQATFRYLDKLRHHPLLADVVAYVLMPSSYHLILKQHIDGGVSRFMANMQNSYTRYFNAHKDRKGMLFERQFNALPIENDQHILYLTKYLHLKPLQENRVQTLDELFAFDWSSLSEYTETKPEHLRFCNRDAVMHQVGGPEGYRQQISQGAISDDEYSTIRYLIPALTQ